MIRILFVDEDTRILQGLRRLLHQRRHTWDMVFVESGQAALEELEQRPADVIVSDMRMPGMDGAQLLTIVKERFPDMVRIILSGHPELMSAIKSVPVAHQLLNKPCEPDELRNAIERSTELHRRLRSPELRRVVCQIDALPSSPKLVEQLSEALEEPDPSLDVIVAIITGDVAMTAKMLQLANSAFFGLAHEVVDVRDALMTLGIETFRYLATVVEIFHGFAINERAFGQLANDLQSHSTSVGTFASQVPTDPVVAREAGMAGLLHDVGTLILASALPDELLRAMDTARAQKRPLVDVEREIIGASHADLGAELLRLWGLPYSIIEPVARHHDAPAMSSRRLDAVHAVYVGEMLAQESGSHGWELMHEQLDNAYLQELGIVERVNDIRSTMTQT